MAGCRQLDASRRARSKRVIAQLALFLGLLGTTHVSVHAQDSPSDATRLPAARAAFDASRWEEAARLAQGPPEQTADLDFLAGLAFAHLERWNDARDALEAGHRKSPGDTRFLVELAGVAYKQKDFRTAKRDLEAALLLDPHDAYTCEFLGALYFLEGNLEAALKYWNAVDKPRLRAVDFVPAPKLRQELLAHAVAFSAPQVLTREALENTQARLGNLGVFPHQRIGLVASKSGDYDATLDLDERTGWGDSKLEAIISLLSGLPYETVYPEFYNLRNEAVNFTSLVRWDSEKRRYSGELSAPLFHDPARRIRAYFDARNENWNLSQTFFGAGAPLTDLNMGAGAGTRDSSLLIDSFAISKAILHQPNNPSSPIAALLRFGLAESVRSCTFQSAVLHCIRRRRPAWDAVFMTLSDLSRRYAERCARTGFPAPRATTMKCKPKSEPEALLEECLSTNYFSLVSNATMIFGYAASRARWTAAREQLHWDAAIFWRIGSWTRIFTEAHSST